MAQTMRLGGTLGILGVLLFILATLGFMLRTSSYIAPAHTATLYDVGSNRMLTVDLPRNGFPQQLVLFGGHVLTPLLFLAAYSAFAEWQRRLAPHLATWLAQIVTLGLYLWICSGLLRVLAIPALAAADPTKLITPSAELFAFSLINSLYDGAYLILALHSILIGLMLRRQGYPSAGGTAIFNGVISTAIILAGPDTELSLLNVFAYGAPVVTCFGISGTLLVEADKAVTQA